MTAPPDRGLTICLISSAVFQAAMKSSDVMGFQWLRVTGISSSGPTSIANRELGFVPNYRSAQCIRVCVYYCRTYYKAVCGGGGGQ